MKNKIHPVALASIGVAILVILGFLGYKVFFSNEGAEGKPTIIAYDKNDPKFQPKMPSNMSGGQ